MNELAPGANAPLPAAQRLTVQVTYAREHADVICLLLDANDRGDGDNGVALFSQPVCGSGSVRLDPQADRVEIDLTSVPPKVERVLIVANADTRPTIDQLGSVEAVVSADGSPVAKARFDQPPQVATMQLVEIYRRTGAWKVRALGDGYAAGLARLLTVHGIEVRDEPAAAPPTSAPAPPPPPPAATPAPPPPAPPATPAHTFEKPDRQPASVDLRKPDLPAGGMVKLTKGEGVTLRKEGRALTQVSMGLGWDAAKAGRSIDLDASCVLLDAAGGKVDAISFLRLTGGDGSVRHSGDNLTGEGEGDDETIHVDLPRVPENVHMLAFTVNSFQGQGFNQVANAFCRLLDGSGKEQVRFDLSATGSHKGVVMATVERTDDGAWTMTARGDMGSGRTYKGLMPIITGYFTGEGGGGAPAKAGGRLGRFLKR